MSRLWGNNSWGAHFDDRYITDIGVVATKSSRVDSNWICDIFDDKGSLKREWENAGHKYWAGEPHLSKEPIWERIVEGAVTIWSMESKKEALKEVQTIWPQSLGLLAHSVNCASYGSFDGEMFPVWRFNKESINISYHLRLVDSLNGEFIEKMSDFIKKNPRLGASTNYNGECILPDLSGFSKELKSSEKNTFGRLIKSFLCFRNAVNNS